MSGGGYTSSVVRKALSSPNAGMAKLADAADLKSAGAQALGGFESHSRHLILLPTDSVTVTETGIPDGHPGESADEKGSLACAPEAEWLVACIRWIRRAVEREHTRVLSAPPPTTE